MPRSLPRPLAALLIALPAIWAAWGIFRYAVDVPFYDAWHEARVVLRFLEYGLSWGDVWAPYNQHRLFFARLIWLPLSRLTGWNVVAELWVSWALGLVALEFLLRTADRSGISWRTPLGTLLAIVFSFLCFSITQLPRWLYGFHLQIPLALVFALGGFAVLNAPRFSWAVFAGAALCGVLSAFSFSAGLAFWPAAMLLLLTMEFPNKAARMQAALAWLGLTALVFCIHLGGPSGSLHAATPLKEPARLPEFLSVYMGHAFLLDPLPTRIAGAFGLLYFLMELSVTATGRSAPRGRWQFLALAAMIVAAAVMTAAARTHNSYENFSAVRYMPIRDLFWAALAGLAAMRLKEGFPKAAASSRKTFAALTWAVLALMAAALLNDNRTAWGLYKYYSAYFHEARAAVLNGDPSEAMLLRLYPKNAQVARDTIPQVRAARLSLFRQVPVDHGR